MMKSLPHSIRRFLKPAILAPCFAVVIGGGSWALFAPSTATPGTTADAFHLANRGNFTIALPTGGSLEAVEVVTVRNLVPGRTQILSIIKEGTIVKEGDLLVELDSNDIENQLTQAEIAYQQSVSAVAELEERNETLQSENVIRLRDAELALELAQTDLEKYNQGQLPQLRKKSDSAINLASEELRRAQDRLAGTRKLEAKGYATSSELVADELVVKRRQIELETAQEEQRMLIEFDAPRTRRQLAANVENLKVRLERTIRQNDSQLEKAKMQLESARETLDLRAKKLEELRNSQQFTKIYAPQGGLVVYYKSPSWRGEAIEEGATVRERQELISLPDVSRMKVNVNIYENQISLIKPGMRAHVKLDALPDQRFNGEVISIASMPEPARDGNPNYRVYKAEVLVTDSLPEIKPGITARVDVLVAELSDVIKVPIQSVVGVGERQYCYVQREGRAVPVEVEVGLFDSDFVEIRKGVSHGDLVSLAPPASHDLENETEAEISIAKTSETEKTLLSAAR
jgi:HlyD family secretion protein